MNKIIRFYNRNRQAIIKSLIWILFIIIIIITIKSYIENKDKDKIKFSDINSKNIIIDNDEKVTIKTEPILGSNKEAKEQEKDVKRIISKFLEQINEGNIQDSYNMLTEECKKVLYPTINDFYNNYVVENLSYDVNFELEHWLGNTYKVNIIPNLLAEGRFEENKTKLDYITIVKVKNEYKLNINSFIARKSIGKEEKIDNCSIKVNYKDIFMNNEIYNFTIENNNDFSIILDELTDVHSMYLLLENKTKDYAHVNELSQEQLKIKAREIKNLNIKYYSRYVSNKGIKSIVFEKAHKNFIGEGKYEVIEIEL